jgi:hypothetical protein
MCHNRKENKNISMTNFVQFYIISQHLCGIFKRHGVSIKWYSCHKHKCCPTSDVSLPDKSKRISPIRGVVREREYYGWDHPYFSECKKKKQTFTQTWRSLVKVLKKQSSGVKFVCYSGRSHHRMYLLCCSLFCCDVSLLFVVCLLWIEKVRGKDCFIMNGWSEI